jgi:glycosyltransferase involved in cell wall biosynthesis
MYVRTIRPLWITNIYLRAAVAMYLMQLMIVKHFRPDVIHVHFHQAGLLAMLFCKFLGIKMVTTEHWTAFVGFPEIPAQRFAKAARVFSFSKHVLPVSRHLLHGIEEKTGVSISPKSTVVNNAVDTTIFHYERVATIGAGEKILVVARLDEQKDLPNLFAALSKLKVMCHTPRVRVVGKGDPEQYHQLIIRYDIRQQVEFIGERPKSAIADEMRAADVLCLSSISENSPCVIGEALCTGLPVVSTNVGGIPELIDESNGILVPPRDPEQLANALYTALYERTFDSKQISLRAQKHFSYHAIGAQIYNIYEKVLS